MKKWLLVSMLLFSAAAFAQGPPCSGMMHPPEKNMFFLQRGPGGPGGPGFERGPMGQWWKNSDVVKKVGVSDDQIKKIEQVFLDHRLKLIDIHAALEKEEVKLQPMIDADSPNDQQIMAQIDRIANSRAQLEKANAQMLLDIRHILTLEQWKKLQSIETRGPIMMRRHGNKGRPGMGGVTTGGMDGGPGAAPVAAAPAEGTQAPPEGAPNE